MKLLPWFITAASAILLIHIFQDSKLGATSTNDAGIDELSEWGAKQFVGGTLRKTGGRIKKGGANLTGDSELGVEGIIDEIAGGIKVTAGKAAQVVQQEVRDLGR